MKKLLTLAAASLSVAVSTGADAFWSNTHSRIVLDAIAYMKANPTTTNYAQLVAGATKAGYTIDQFATELSVAAADVDNFNDTYICGAITGDCEVAPVWGLASGIVNVSMQVAGALGVALLGDPIDLRFAVGTLLVLSGVLIVNLRSILNR